MEVCFALHLGKPESGPYDWYGQLLTQSEAPKTAINEERKSEKSLQNLNRGIYDR